jgi:hypothetical protein
MGLADNGKGKKCGELIPLNQVYLAAVDNIILQNAASWSTNEQLGTNMLFMSEAVANALALAAYNAFNTTPTQANCQTSYVSNTTGARTCVRVDSIQFNS